MTSYPNASGPFQSVSKFLVGVPFAAPPTGELRFKAPKPQKEWKQNVYSAKPMGASAYSPNVSKTLSSLANFTFSEDFLYLAIYRQNNTDFLDGNIVFC